MDLLYSCIPKNTNYRECVIKGVHGQHSHTIISLYTLIIRLVTRGIFVVVGNVN